MTITAKYPGRCAACGGPVQPGQTVEWDKTAKKVRHLNCNEAPQAADAAPLSFTPTGEQGVALEMFAGGDSLAIEAGAGTGKTSTLRLLAESTSRRGQYIAFNKAIVTEAGAKMPGTVTCSTAHSLAYRAVGKRYSDRLRNSRRMKSLDIALALGIEEVQLDDHKPVAKSFLGGVAMEAVRRFCQSADDEIAAKHVPYIEGLDTPTDGRRNYGNNNIVARALVPALRRAWADLMSDNGRLPFKHDHYLKAWQLSGPRIAADFILFDEAQDANPVMVAIVAAQQHAQLVWVGDSQQQIYTFTGAVNALAGVPAEQRAFLTQSFRFGPAIAEVANTILARLPDAELRIIGTPDIASVVGPVAEPDAVLTRTNAAAVETVLHTQQSGRQAALVGGGEEVVRFAKASVELTQFGRTEHPDLACFDSWGEVQAYVNEDEQGGELRLLVSLVDRFGVPTILDALDRVIREEDADVTVSTAHKAKGREWDAVQLAGDFPEPEKQGDEELRLLYVACTRAKRELDIEAVVIEAAAQNAPETAQIGA
jgi:superfamily I DNA/RNA helicase